ncbi:hypothetical protein cyc_04529 [Cyclospora cayetanensis]|uniref:Uncharacterized protein n=1 Tax=Cyclospora cayetanensis TaxID=88456 RepID=A0A1D3CXK4_9EIME|nr:hypothetical protein cyc_04529 [Cyclospora cayetanensis]
MPVKAAKGKGKGRKGGVKGPKKAPNKAITLALGHPPAVGPWNPLPLDQQIDAFAGAIAKPNAVVTSTAGGPTLCGQGILSSGKPAAPPRYFVPTRDAAIAAITKAAEARRQRELAAANQETEAAFADVTTAAATTEKDSTSAVSPPSETIPTAATHASAAAFRAGSLHSNAQYCAMARTLSCLRENIEAETSKGNSGTTKTLDPTAIGERRMYTELQRQLLLLQQPNAPTNGPTEEPVAGSVFWKPPVDSPLLERAPSVTQQWQQQQHQDEGPVESGFCKYVYSHTPLCTPADKLRLYRINLLFRPRPLPAHGQPPWGLVLPDQEGQTEDPTPAPMRPRQWQFEGRAVVWAEWGLGGLSCLTTTVASLG